WLFYFLIYPPTPRFNFREQKRRNMIEYIIKILETKAMLDDTNIVVLKEELNRLVFEDVSGIAAKPLKRSSLRDLYIVMPSNFQWSSIRAGYNSLAEQDGKLVRGVSRIDSIFGIAFGALGVGIMLVGLFVFIYSFALSSQLSARSVIFGII